MFKVRDDQSDQQDLKAMPLDLKILVKAKRMNLNENKDLEELIDLFDLEERKG